jgi:hypothetical protein
MQFNKAKPEQGFCKAAVYGPPGSGKTFTTLLQAEGLAKRDKKRIAFVDTERGTDFYSKEIQSRKIHPEAFDFDCIYTRSLLEVIQSVKNLNPSEHGVIVIDSISHLWDSAISAYEGKMTKAETIPMHAWGKIKKPYKELIRWLMDAPFHVFILGRQKNIFDSGSASQMKLIGVGMRAEAETEYETHICVRMESRKSENNSSRSTNYAIFEKDRTGILSGRTIANPSFKTLEPILPILGGTQAQSESLDEITTKDGNLFVQHSSNKSSVIQ